jgi:hypothetical protein
MSIDDPDQEQVDLEDARMQLEADEVAQHLSRRAGASRYCERARVVDTLLGRLA